MKYNVNANEFCPDDCPYCALEMHKCNAVVIGGTYFPPQITTTCEHAEHCKNAYKLGYEKGNADAYDETADKYITSKKKYTIDELIAKIHSGYDFGEKITDFDAYMIQWLNDISKEEKE